MLTDEEQRLIAKAIMAGKVRRIPMGQSGEVKYRTRAGRKVNVVALSMVRALAEQCMTDREIAAHVGKTRKAVQNIRYRHGVTAGVKRVL